MIQLKQCGTEIFTVTPTNTDTFTRWNTLNNLMRLNRVSHLRNMKKALIEQVYQTTNNHTLILSQDNEETRS